MTLDEKLKDWDHDAEHATFHSALDEYCPPEFRRLLAALRKAIEQRAMPDESYPGHDACDAELLAILNGEETK